MSPHPHQAAMDSAVRYLISNYNPKGNRIGWLMMASILAEAWQDACGRRCSRARPAPA
jgi:hypothetical protein